MIRSYYEAVSAPIDSRIEPGVISVARNWAKNRQSLSFLPY